jgi:hypothetical protein
MPPKKKIARNLSGLRNQDLVEASTDEPCLATAKPAAPPIPKHRIPIAHDSTRIDWAAEYSDTEGSEDEADMIDKTFDDEELAALSADFADVNVEKDADWVPPRLRAAQKKYKTGISSLAIVKYTYFSRKRCIYSWTRCFEQVCSHTKAICSRDQNTDHPK